MSRCTAPPRRAGKGIANPLAQFMSFAMMLTALTRGTRLTCWKRLSTRRWRPRTGDIMTPGCTETGTEGMTAAVIDAMDRMAR